MPTDTWSYHLYESPEGVDVDSFEISSKYANGFIIPHDPNTKPLTLEMRDRILRDIYVPSLLEDLNRPLLFDKLGIKPVEVTPLPEWRKRWLRVKERFVDSYYHLRRGHCDASYEMEHHDCY